MLERIGMIIDLRDILSSVSVKSNDDTFQHWHFTIFLQNELGANRAGSNMIEL